MANVPHSKCGARKGLEVRVLPSPPVIHISSFDSITNFCNSLIIGPMALAERESYPARRIHELDELGPVSSFLKRG